MSKWADIGRGNMVNLDKVIEYGPPAQGDTCVFIRFEGEKHSERFDFQYTEFKKLIQKREKELTTKKENN